MSKTFLSASLTVLASICVISFDVPDLNAQARPATRKSAATRAAFTTRIKRLKAYKAVDITEFTSLAEPVTGWPDLRRACYPNEDCSGGGFECPETGAAKASNPKKAASNILKNRYKLPSQVLPPAQLPAGEFAPVRFADLYKLNQGKLMADGKVREYPEPSNPYNMVPVALVAYVKSVNTSGCKKDQGESCNCNSDVPDICDIHIELTQGPTVNTQKGRNVVVAEVTLRTRRLAAHGLLQHNNVGNDWRAATLRSKIEGHWVRFFGWLFFDEDHFDQAWISDKKDKSGRDNFRETGWEIHPVMGIEVDVPAPTNP